MSLLLFAMGVGIISLLLMLQASLNEGFKKNIRGIDMVVGAKGSPLQLILSSVYHIDNPTGNIPFPEAEKLRKHPLVKNGIALAYGDNYKGFKILGTEKAYIDLYGGEIQTGRRWTGEFEVVLGAILAERFQHKVGDEFYSSHGLIGDVNAHEEHPFKVVGILAPSGSVLDQLVLTGLESVWGVHEDHDHNEAEHKEEEPKDITAMLIKFKSPMGMMQLPRMVNSQTSMQAALPAIEVNRLFELFSVGIQLIRGIALTIMVISGISIFISLYNNLLDRQYELALMRSLGAARGQLFSLVLLEGLIIALIGFFAGILLSRMGIWALDSMIQTNYRYDLDVLETWREEGYLLIGSLVLGFIAALLPAWSAWRTDVTEGLKG